MEEYGFKADNAEIANSLGLGKVERVFWNLAPAELVEDTIILGQGNLSDTGAIAIETGEFTGRSPKDRFVVCDAKTENTVWWGSINIKFAPEKFDALYKKMTEYLAGRDVYVRDAFACADESYKMNTTLNSSTES